jgi:hypothetical protein
MATPKKAAAFQPSGDVRRVQSLNEGRHVRIFDHLGKSHHMSTSGVVALAALLEDIRSESPEMYERIGNELADMGVTVPEVVDVDVPDQ